MEKYQSNTKKAGYITGAIVGLGAMLMPTTPQNQDSIDAEVLSNLMPENAQVETAQTDYKASALENLTQALAPNKAFAQTNQNYQRPDDATLKEWMNQPVEETLAGTNYTKVNDDNYQREVLEANQPTMVFFYTNAGEYSWGLAALTKALHKQFPEIKLCAYKLTDGVTTPRGVYNHVTSEYPVEKTPSLLFYESKDFGSGTEIMPENWHMQGGIVTFDYLDGKIGDYYKHIPKNFID